MTRHQRFELLIIFFQLPQSTQLGDAKTRELHLPTAEPLLRHAQLGNDLGDLGVPVVLMQSDRHLLLSETLPRLGFRSSFTMRDDKKTCIPREQEREGRSTASICRSNVGSFEVTRSSPPANENPRKRLAKIGSIQDNVRAIK